MPKMKKQKPLSPTEWFFGEPLVEPLLKDKPFQAVISEEPLPTLKYRSDRFDELDAYFRMEYPEDFSAQLVSMLSILSGTYDRPAFQIWRMLAYILTAPYEDSFVLPPITLEECRLLDKVLEKHQFSIPASTKQEQEDLLSLEELVKYKYLDKFNGVYVLTPRGLLARILTRSFYKEYFDD
jgi:hypothetical protein